MMLASLCDLFYLTWPMTFILVFQGGILKKTIAHELEGRLTWNQRDVSQ